MRSQNNIWIIFIGLIVISMFLFTGCKAPSELAESEISAEDQMATQVSIQLTVDAGVKMTLDAQGQSEAPSEAQEPETGGDSQPSHTATPTTESTATNTPEPTATVTSEEQASVSVEVDTNCRQGPGKPYDIVGGLLVGEEAIIKGVPETEMNYVIIKNPDAAGDCWLWTEYAKISGDLAALPKIFIPPTPTPEPASIAGIVWNDKCTQAGGDPPPGCIEPENAGDPYPANGKLDSGETGLAGIIVRLGSGACPSSGLATTTTAADGTYAFTDLNPGTYCVSIDVDDPANTAILVPGSWSYPRGYNAQTVDVGGGEDKTGISFGWDFQAD